MQAVQQKHACHYWVGTERVKHLRAGLSPTPEALEHPLQRLAVEVHHRFKQLPRLRSNAGVGRRIDTAHQFGDSLHALL